jgi:hypothetical protein
MIKKQRKPSYIDYVGCFGDFNIKDTICRKRCSLNIRCALERDQSIRLELLEDLIATDDMTITMQ